MDSLRKLVKEIYKVYVAIGMFSVALLAGCVIYTVIMRYCFNISYTFLEEFTTTILAFVTFWGVGVCVIEDEHVAIDSIYNHFPAKVKRVVGIINYIIVLIVVGVMFKYGLDYALKYGDKISMGMQIPMIWMYGIIPLSMGITFICIIIKLVKKVVTPVDIMKLRKE